MFKNNKCQPACWLLVIGLLVTIISFFSYLKLNTDSPQPVQTVVNVADYGYCYPNMKLIPNGSCDWYYQAVYDESDDPWQFLLPLALGLNLLALVWLATAMTKSCQCRQSSSGCCTGQINSSDKPSKSTQKLSKK